MTTNVQSLTQAVSSSAQRTPSAGLGKDDFLKMLVTQLRYQDPLDPMKGTEFASQLAQFSSLEQLSNINTNLTQSLDATSMLSYSINNALSATFIGKSVCASTDTFHYSGSGEVTVGYNLQTPASAVAVKVYDQNKNLVKTFHGGVDEGNNKLAWDGTTDSGTTALPGSYTFTVEAEDSNGTALDTTKFVYGKVQGVRFKSGGTVFVIDGVEVLLSNILEISEG